MKLLITGGAGFIGSHLASRMLEKGYDVWVTDNLSTGKKENIPAGATFIQADLTQEDSLGRLPSDFDAVCHLAAQSAGAVSAERPYYDLQMNAGATLLLSRWCVKNGIRRFLYASSMTVYGDIERSPVSEDAPCLPRSYYGVSKLASEHLLRLCAMEGLKVTCLRMFTSYGPGQDLGNLKQGMVSIYLAYLLRGVPVPVTGSLERFRDIVHVSDIVQAWEKTLGFPETPRLAYNIGSGKPTKVRELLAELKKAMGLPQDYPVEEKPGSPADQFGLYADISRAKADLGFSPSVSLAAGLKDMAAWAKSQ